MDTCISDIEIKESKVKKIVTFAADVHVDSEEDQGRPLHRRRFSESNLGSSISNINSNNSSISSKKDSNMPLTLLKTGSTSTTDLRKAATSKRRFSLLNYIVGRSTLSLNRDEIEETDEQVDETAFDVQNERLLISFADIYGGHDGECHENRMFQPDSTVTEHNVSFFGKKGRAQGEYQDAKDISILSGNRLLITDLINNRIQLCNTAGRMLLMYTGTDVAEPWGTSCIDNKCVAMTSRKNKCVRVLDLDGEVTLTFGQDFFTSPTGIACDSQGNFVVCDAGADTVSIHDKHGNFVRYIGDPETPEGTFSRPRYVCITDKDEIIVSDSGNHKIKIFSSDGDFIRSFGSFGKGDNQFKSPYGVCTNKIGDIYVSDHYNNRVSMFTSGGVFIRHLVTSEDGLRHPQGLALKAGAVLFITHGDLKASEVLVYRMNAGYTCAAADTNDQMIVCHF